jgi:glucokinase
MSCATSDASRPPRTVVAIDFGGTKIDVALADRTGGILRRVRLDTLALDGPEQAIRRAADAARTLARTLQDNDEQSVSAYAAVCPGVIQDQQVLLAPNLPGWQHLPFARRLAQELGVADVAVTNDVRAGALAEMRFGSLRNAEPAIYVSLGTGIAAALVAQGQVVSGAHRAAGEIAYLAVGGSAPLRAGQASLEDVVGGRSLAERASAILGQPTSAQQLFGREDPVARQLVHQALDALSGAIANLAVFVDPERIAVGGGMMAAADTILPVLEARLRQVVPFPPELVTAHFTQDASLHGAIALALDAVADSAPRELIPSSGAST